MDGGGPSAADDSDTCKEGGLEEAGVAGSAETSGREGLMVEAGVSGTGLAWASSEDIAGGSTGEGRVGWGFMG